MSFVIRFEKFRSVGYWTGTTADTEKEKARLYATKGEAQKELEKIRLNKAVSAKVVFDIWNQKRKPKPKEKPKAKPKAKVKAIGKKKTQRLVKKKSSSKRSRASA